MTKIVAVTSCPTGIAHTFMAAESLQRGAEALGHTIKVETQGSVGSQNTLSDADIRNADLVIIAADAKVDLSRFAGKPIYETSTKAAISDSQGVVKTALNQVEVPEAAPVQTAGTKPSKIVAITSCPTGIAHTFMAAEGLQRGAEALGHTIKVETQGSVGAENKLTDAEIRDADLVIIAADAKVDLSRFAGKPIYETSTNAAINDGQGVVKTAFAQATTAKKQGTRGDYEAQVQAAKAARSKSRTGAYKHLMTGVSYMIPFVVAGGILIALAFAIGGYKIAFYDTSNITVLTTGFAANPLQSIGAALFVAVAKAGFLLFVPILAGFIAYSFAARPGHCSRHDRWRSGKPHRVWFPGWHHRRLPRGLYGLLAESEHQTAAQPGWHYARPRSALARFAHRQLSHALRGGNARLPAESGEIGRAHV